MIVPWALVDFISRSLCWTFLNIKNSFLRKLLAKNKVGDSLHQLTDAPRHWYLCIGLLVTSDDSNKCFKECGSKRLNCNAGCQEVSRCRTISESGVSITYRQRSTYMWDPSWLWNPGQMSKTELPVALRKGLGFKNLMAYSHCLGTGPGRVQRTGPAQ